MNKAVLISIRPEWIEKIARGQKTIEVRKTRPSLSLPFKCYIYCTKPGKILAKGLGILNGQVIGEFVCDSITKADVGSYCKISSKDSCIRALDLMNYANEKPVYGWHITHFIVYRESKKLSDFKNWNRSVNDRSDCYLLRSPQSWCYVEELT